MMHDAIVVLSMRLLRRYHQHDRLSHVLQVFDAALTVSMAQIVRIYDDVVMPLSPLSLPLIPGLFVC